MPETPNAIERAMLFLLDKYGNAEGEHLIPDPEARKVYDDLREMLVEQSKAN